MRAVVQRVSRAAVTVAGETVADIGGGLLVLLGVGRDDGPEDAATVAGKIAGLRVFPDENGRMNRDLADAGGAVLVVSQFTLVADLRKGRRPSFALAAEPDTARRLVDAVVVELRSAGLEVATGRFGAAMEVDLVNDGPVTIVVDTAAGAIV